MALSILSTGAGAVLVALDELTKITDVSAHLTWSLLTNLGPCLAPSLLPRLRAPLSVVDLKDNVVSRQLSVWRFDDVHVVDIYCLKFRSEPGLQSASQQADAGNTCPLHIISMHRTQYVRIIFLLGHCVFAF